MEEVNVLLIYYLSNMLLSNLFLTQHHQNALKFNLF